MKMLKIFIFIYFLFVLAHKVHAKSTGIGERNQLSEKSHYYKNSFHDVDDSDETEQKLIQNNQEHDDVVDNDDFDKELDERNYKDYSYPNEVSEDSIDDDDDSSNIGSESESEVLLNEELMKLSLDSFKALKEAVNEIDEQIEVNQKAKRETHLKSTKRKFKNEDDNDDELEENNEQTHKDNKRHESCHCSKNCASVIKDEGIIEKKIHAKINKLKDSSKMDKKRFLGYSKQSIRRNKRSASTDTLSNDSKQEISKESLDKIREQYLESFPKDEGNMASISTFRKSDQFLQRVKRDN